MYRKPTRVMLLPANFFEKKIFYKVSTFSFSNKYPFLIIKETSLYLVCSPYPQKLVEISVELPQRKFLYFVLLIAGCN